MHIDNCHYLNGKELITASYYCNIRSRAQKVSLHVIKIPLMRGFINSDG